MNACWHVTSHNMSFKGCECLKAGEGEKMGTEEAAALFRLVEGSEEGRVVNARIVHAVEGRVACTVTMNGGVVDTINTVTMTGCEATPAEHRTAWVSSLPVALSSNVRHVPVC